MATLDMHGGLCSLDEGKVTAQQHNTKYTIFSKFESRINYKLEKYRFLNFDAEE
jgi:hypothetical protein